MNVTPLVDVVLVLLIIFMVVVPLMEKNAKIDIPGIFNVDPERKGGVIAAANLISFVGVFAAAGAYFAMSEWLRLRADDIFLAGACMTLAATLYAVLFLPDSMLRLALWALTHSVYRIHVEGRDNIPERGVALFLTRELTLLETMFLAAATDRPIHFVAGAKLIASTPPLLRKALRITDGSEDRLAKAGEGIAKGILNGVGAAFSSGEVLCLAGEAVSEVLASPTEGARLEALLEASRVPVVMVSIGEAAGRPLEDGDVHSGPARTLSSAGRVKVKFGAPMLPGEARFTQALNWVKSAELSQLSAPSPRD